TGSTANRYSTPRLTTGAYGRSAKIAPVTIATAAMLKSAPAAALREERRTALLTYSLCPPPAMRGRRSVLSGPVVEPLCTSDQADPVPRDLVRAWVVTDVVRLAGAVRQEAETVLTGTERVGDARPRRAGDDVAGAHRDLLLTE